MEALAVVRRISMLDDGFDMFLCRVSHVPFPSVLRIFLRQPAHVLVPVGLRQHRCSGDRCIGCIPLDHALVPIAVERLEPVAVDEQVLRSDVQSADRPLHAGDRRVEDVYPVDFLSRNLLDRPCYGLLFDDRAQDFPCLFGHLLGVVEQRVVEVFR